MKVGYMGIDQYGHTHHIGDRPPRKGLLELLGRQRASKMYVETKDGGTRHVGYVVAGLWVRIMEVHSWKGGRR